MDLRKSVMSGLRWSAALRLLSQLFTWGVTIFVMRLLSPSDYGLMELATVFISFLAMISELGLGVAIIQRRDLNDSDLRSIFSFILLASTFFGFSLFITAPFISTFYQEPALTSLLRVLSVIFLLSGLATVPWAILQREHKYREIAIIELVAAVVGSIATLTLALLGFGVWALVAGFVMIRIASLLGFHIARPFVRLPRFEFKGMGPVFLFSWNVTLSRILWYLYANAAASLIIGKVLGKELLGIYGVGLYLACLPMDKVGGIINLVALPAFSSIQHDRSLAGAHFLKAIRVLAFIAVPLFWGISSISSEIISVFLGDKWVAAALPLQIIALGVPLRMVRNLMMPAMVGLGRSNINLHIELVATAILSASFFVATYWGLIGVSLVWILIFPMVFILNLAQIVSIMHISMTDVFNAMQRPILAGVVMYAGIAVTRDMQLIDFSKVWNMGFYIVIGATIYSLVTLLINRKGFREVMVLIKS